MGVSIVAVLDDVDFFGVGETRGGFTVPGKEVGSVDAERGQ